MTEGTVHIFRGTNPERKVYPWPCPNCGSLTYLGVFIPTVSVFTADYYGASYQCHNQSCDPVYDEIRLPSGKVVYDLVDSGAYWSDEDEYYYTPQSPRL